MHSLNFLISRTFAMSKKPPEYNKHQCIPDDVVDKLENICVQLQINHFRNKDNQQQFHELNCFNKISNCQLPLDNKCQQSIDKNLGSFVARLDFNSVSKMTSPPNDCFNNKYNEQYSMWENGNQNDFDNPFDGTFFLITSPNQFQPGDICTFSETDIDNNSTSIFNEHSLVITDIFKENNFANYSHSVNTGSSENGIGGNFNRDRRMGCFRFQNKKLKSNIREIFKKLGQVNMPYSIPKMLWAAVRRGKGSGIDDDNWIKVIKNFFFLEQTKPSSDAISEANKNLKDSGELCSTYVSNGLVMAELQTKMDQSNHKDLFKEILEALNKNPQDLKSQRTVRILDTEIQIPLEFNLKESIDLVAKSLIKNKKFREILKIENQNPTTKKAFKNTNLNTMLPIDLMEDLISNSSQPCQLNDN